MSHSSEYRYYLLNHSLIHIITYTVDHLHKGVPSAHTDTQYQIQSNKTSDLISYLEVYVASFRLLFLSSKLSIETLGKFNDCRFFFIYYSTYFFIRHLSSILSSPLA